MPSFPTLFLAATTATFAFAQTTLIPTDCFSSETTFTNYFSYNYPWSSDVHNGGARMTPSHCTLDTNTLIQTATYTPSEPDTSDLAINYLSCTVYANQNFVVEADGGLDFSAEFLAPVERGTWPAFWLSGTDSWPPEIDIAEWKGSGLISFNTFNASDAVDALDRQYPDPGSWHEVRAELRDHGGDVQTKFFLDGIEQTTQYGAGYTGAGFWLIIDLQMEGSSGSPGPTTDTTFSIRNLQVTSYNP